MCMCVPLYQCVFVFVCFCVFDSGVGGTLYDIVYIYLIMMKRLLPGGWPRIDPTLT